MAGAFKLGCGTPELNFCSLIDSLCRCGSIMVSIYLRFPFHKHGVLAFFFSIRNRLKISMLRCMMMEGEGYIVI